MNEAGQGQIVTFYSYKGGTGRTMTLANVAWILASNGNRVLVVDWDLESPGLHRFFHPFLDETLLTATPGVIEIINDYATAATDPTPRPDNWHTEYAQVQRHAVSLSWDFPGGGGLDFLSAGRQNRDYSAAVCSLDWDNFYDRLGGGRFFRAMRADMKSNYDYVLIDSRTGLSDVAEICTIELPDVLVVCFTLSDQSIDGAAAVGRQISGRYREKNITVLPVPMRIEDGEKEKLDVGRALARTRFEGFPEGLSAEETALYWTSVEVPYKPFYAFEETLATFGDEPGSPRSLLSSFERITARVTGGRVTRLEPMKEDIRLQWKDAFARRAPVTATQVFVSYAPEDRVWADWIEAILTRSGFAVLPRSTVTTASGAGALQAESELQNASRAIAVLSSAYLGSPDARSIWKMMAAADAAGPQRRLVPLRIGDMRIGDPFNALPMVDLVRLDAEHAAGKLLSALDRPSGPPSDALRTDHPRFPAAVPPIWDMPARNADFTGRSDTLEELRDRLSGGGVATVQAQALYGLGGVGKTQVAQEYAYRFMGGYDVVWWVPSEHTEEITAALAELARKLGLRVSDNVAEAALAALEELRRDPSRHWLLVFDNADNPKELEPYLPTGTVSGHVLITSRNQAWTHVAETLEVDVFTGDESVGHLLRHVPEMDPADAKRLAIALGHLPLAIEQASAWLEQTGMPASDYIEELSTQATRTLSLNAPADYPTPVVATWNLSFDRLRERSPAAVRLLRLLAFFSPGPISMTLLYSDEMMRSLQPYDSSLTEKLMLGRVIRDISRLALFKVDQGSNSVQIHRLVQEVIRSEMTGDEQEAASHEVHEILVGARPRRGDTDDPDNWDRYNIIWPHLVPSRAEECNEDQTRQLLIDFLRYQWKHSEYDACLNLGNRLVPLWTQQLGQDHPQTLHLQFNIANVLRSQGRYEDARELDTYVLERQRAVLTPDHPHVLMTAGGLAADLRALGEFTASLDSDRETYESFKDQFGEDYPRTLAAAHNLACSLRLVGAYFDARTLDEDTLRRRRDVLGEDHPYTLYSAADLARDMRETGLYTDSIELLKTTLDRYRAVLGDDLPDTLRTAKSLAVSLRKAGERSDALSLTQQTYERYRRRYGDDSPDSLACALNLASDYSGLGDKPRAVAIASRVHAEYRATLGEDHPNTLVAANNLANYLRGTGNPEAARTLAENTLRMMRERLGDQHPYTLSCVLDVASCLADLGDLDRAAELERDTIAGLRETLGPQHPDTLAAALNLCATLHLAGRDEEAGVLKEQTMGDLSRVLGTGHPHVARLRSWRRVSRDLEPQPV